MNRKPSYQELEKQVRQLQEALKANNALLDGDSRGPSKSKIVPETVGMKAVAIDSPKNTSPDRGAEEHRKLILETMGEMLAYHDTDLRVQWANKAAAESVGKTSEELVGLHCYEIWQNRDKPCENCPVLEAMATGAPCQQENMTPDGRVFRLRGYPVCDAVGNMIGAVEYGEDVTEAKMVERELRASLKFNESLLDGTPYPVVVIDRDTSIQYVNEAFEKLTGFCSAEVAGTKAPYPWWVEDEMEKTLREFSQALTNGANKVEVVFRKKNGELFRVEITSTPIFNGSPDSYYISNWVDITERDRAETALRESEELFRTVFAQAAVGVAQVLPDGRFEKINSRFCEIVGYARDELLGMTFADITHPDDLHLDRENIELVLSGKIDSFEIEKRYIRKDGGIVWVRLYSNCVRDETDGVKYAVAAVADVTRQKRNEETMLRQQRAISTNNRIAKVFLSSSSENMYADVLEVVLDALKSRYGLFGYIDEEGDLVCPSMTRNVWDECRIENKSIVFPKSSWGGLWGRSLMERKTLCANHGLVLPEGHVPMENALVAPVVHHGELIGQFAVADKDGGYNLYDQYLLESVASQTAPILHAHLEQTRQEKERAKLEKRLRIAQKMESIGNLAGGIAHDFNNILYPIIGLSELLSEDLDPDSPEYENALEILNAGKRGGELVKQILAFSRRSEHKMLPVRIQKVLEEVLKLVRSTIPSDIEIAGDIQSDCGLVLADPTQLHQIAMNLITNAYHAVEGHGGRISVVLRETAWHDGYPDGNDAEPKPCARLTVSDTGCGIDKSALDKIFEPYFTTKEQGKGTGLGLAVVYGIVKEHRGDIKVYSEKGVGTTFHVYLPLMETDTASSAEKQAPACPPGSERILLVDDEGPIARLETQILKRLGYQVTCTSDSLDAMERFKAAPDSYDLVFTDMTMPNMTGDRLAREMLAIRPDIPVIICTGFSERINRVKAESIGVKRLLMKPVAASTLAQEIRWVLDEAKPAGRKTL